jgi:hypothetical protein
MISNSAQDSSAATTYSPTLLDFEGAKSTHFPRKDQCWGQYKPGSWHEPTSNRHASGKVPSAGSMRIRILNPK